MSDVTVTLELTAEQAAGLRRFADKSGWSEAMAVLYGHVRKDLREQQASAIISALAVLENALAEAEVATFPWIETGRGS
jgi:hypothetical protein